MKTDRKVKVEKSPPKVKTIKENARATSKTNGKHPLTMYEHIPVGIVQASLDGKYIDVNEEFCRILGYSRRELLRRGIKDCTHEEDYGVDIRLYEQLIAGKIPFYRLEKRFVRKQGEIIWVELTRSLVCDAKGKPLHTVGLVLDISDRKDVEKVLRDSVERLRLATGAAQMFMWEWDFQTQNYILADNFEQVLGFSGGLLPRNKFETIWSLSPEEDVKRVVEEFQLAVANRSDLRSLPIRVINPENGQVVWLEVSAKIVYASEGTPERIFGVAQNITENRVAEAALQKSEHQLRLVTNAIPALISYIDKEYRYRFVNQAYNQWFGYESEEVVGKKAVEILGEAAFETLRPHMEAALAGNVEVFETETPYQHGGTRFIRATYTPDIAPDGTVSGIFVLVLDITERKQSEESLAEFARQQEALYRLSDQLHRTDSLENVFNAALDAILSALQCDRASILLYDNTDVMRFVAWRGLSDAYRTATDGHSPWTPDTVNPQPISMDDVRTAELSDSLRQVILEEGIGSLAFIPLVSNGKLIGKFMVYFNTPHAFHAGELDLSLTIGHQLAFGIEQKRAEEQLRAKEAELEDVINHTPFMLTRCSRDLRYRFVSRVYAEMIGHTPEEVAGKPLVEIMGEEGLQTIMPYVQAVLEGNQVEYESEVSFKDGGNPFLHVVYTPDRDEKGNVIGWFASIVDISERKRAEEKIRQSEERFRQAADAAGALVYEVDLASGTSTIVHGLKTLAGYDQVEVAASSDWWHSLIHPDDLPGHLAQLDELLKNGETDVCEYRVKHQNGEWIFVQDNRLVISNETGQPIRLIGAVIDITARKQTETRLALLAEIGEMLRNFEDPYELMYRISESIGEHLQVKRALFNEIDMEHDREIVYRDYHNGVESVAGIHKVTDYSSVTSAEVATGRTVVNTDSKIDPRTAQDYERTYALTGERAYVVVPLMRDNRWVASFWVSDDMPRQWTSEEVSLLETVAERTWTVIERLRIDAALRESESRFREIFETASVSVWLQDFTQVRKALDDLRRQGVQDLRAYFREHPEFVQKTIRLVQIVDVNNETVELFNAKDKTELLQSLDKVFVPETTPVFEEELIALAEGREVLRSETIVQTLDGRRISVIFTIHFGPAGGDLSRVVITLTDITERKRAEEALRESEQRYRFIVENTSDGIWWIELTEPMPLSLSEEEQIDWYYKHAVMRQCNLGMARMYGYNSIEEVVGLPIQVVMPRENLVNLELLRQFVRSGYRLVDAESREVGRDGQELIFLNNMVGVIDDGKLAGEWGTNRDITERKRAEEALRASEALYRAIAGNVPGGGVYVVDKDFRYLVVEGPVTEAFGLSRELLEGHTVKEVFPDERGTRMEDRLRRTFAGERVEFETQFNGRFYWTQMAPLYDSIGQAIILTLDITERKQAEDALRQSEERFSRFMEQLPGLAWIKDMDGRYVYANATAEKAFHRPREKLYGMTDDEIFPPETAAQFRRNDAQALADEKGVQLIETLEQEDGVLHYSLVSKFPIPGPDGSPRLIGGTAFDITERLQAEEALRESEERFRAILRQATAGIVRKDAEGKLLFVNEAFCNMLGYTEPELIGKTVWEFMHPDDVDENRRSYERLMEEGIPFKQERRFLRQDGTMIWVDASVSPIMDSTGKPQSAVAVEVDITGRKQAEEALQQLNAQLEDRVLNRTAKLRAANQILREEIAERQRVEQALRQSEAVARANEEKLSTLFELLPVGISFLDPAGQIIQVNPALETIMKLPKEQLSDQAYRSRQYIRANGTTMPPAEFASQRALTEGKIVYNMETGVVLEDGEVIWTSVSAAPVNVAEVGAVVVTADITESKRAERALQESRERLQILSQRLVEVQEEERRAIARELHDRVGQTLAALNINLIIISGQLSGKVDQQIGTRLNDSMKLVAETIALVRDVMSNLRPSVLDDYGLEAAIDSQLNQFTSRYEIGVKFEKPAPPIPRLGPSVEMTFLRIAQEALMNIARHAQATQVHLKLWQEDHTICMTVQDNGTGISSWQDANRPGSHGLTIMRERAEAFGGNLKVSSVPAKGTKVEVKIPIETNDLSQIMEGRPE